jgi:hypothetical protein
MGVLSILNNTVNGISAAQANLASLSTISFKARFLGSWVTGLGDGGQGNLVVISDGGSNFSWAILAYRSGSDVQFWFYNLTTSEWATATIALAGFDAGTYYVVYGEGYPNPSGDAGVYVFDSDGTLKGSGTLGYTPGAGGTESRVYLPAANSGQRLITKIDGLAIYGARLSGDDRWSVPTPEDANLLWLSFFADASGNTITAAVGNDITITGTETTDFAWEAGGTWDAAAGGSVALTGTITASVTESDIVAGGRTIILETTGDEWIPNA